MDNWNKLRNMCSREIGARMKKKEPVGEDDTLPEGIMEKLDSLTAELLKVGSLSITPMALCLLAIYIASSPSPSSH